MFILQLKNIGNFNYTITTNKIDELIIVKVLLPLQKNATPEKYSNVIKKLFSFLFNYNRTAYIHYIPTNRREDFVKKTSHKKH